MKAKKKTIKSAVKGEEATCFDVTLFQARHGCKRAQSLIVQTRELLMGRFNGGKAYHRDGTKVPKWERCAAELHEYFDYPQMFTSIEGVGSWLRGFGDADVTSDICEQTGENNNPVVFTVWWIETLVDRSVGIYPTILSPTFKSERDLVAWFNVPSNREMVMAAMDLNFDPGDYGLLD